MGLDTYSKLLIIADLLALLVLTRYTRNGHMMVLLAILMVIVWVWLYRVLAPFGYGRSILVGFLAGLGLYLPNAQVRAMSAALVVPALASAARSLIYPKAA